MPFQHELVIQNSNWWLMPKLKLQYFGHLMQRTDSLEKTLMLGKIEREEGGEGDDRGWDGWMASLTQWTRVWVGSGSWWWTGKPCVLQSLGSQRVGHYWATELNWNITIMLIIICLKINNNPLISSNQFQKKIPISFLPPFLQCVSLNQARSFCVSFKPFNLQVLSLSLSLFPTLFFRTLFVEETRLFVM